MVRIRCCFFLPAAVLTFAACTASKETAAAPTTFPSISKRGD